MYSFFLLFKNVWLCIVYIDWELEGQKKLKGRDFLSKTLLYT